MEVEEQLVKYENITKMIIEKVKEEDYEVLEELFSQRQLILDNIKNSNSKQELKTIYSKYEINDLNKKLEENINNKKVLLLEKIKESQKRRIGMKGYNNLQSRAVFLSKKL